MNIDKLITDGSSLELTVSLETKWYELFLIRRTDESTIITSIHFGRLEDTANEMNVSAFRDHCPNPAVVEKYGEDQELHIPELAMELITGRWHRESRPQRELREGAIAQRKERSQRLRELWKADEDAEGTFRLLLSLPELLSLEDMCEASDDPLMPRILQALENAERIDE